MFRSESTTGARVVYVTGHVEPVELVRAASARGLGVPVELVRHGYVRDAAGDRVHLTEDAEPFAKRATWATL